MKKLIFAFVIALGAIASASAQTKIAHVNSQKLLDTMPSRKAAIKEINQLEAAGIKELRDMDSAVQAAYQVYMAKKLRFHQLLINLNNKKFNVCNKIWNNVNKKLTNNYKFYQVN